MRVYVDDEPLSLDVADVREYERVLDLRQGILRRTLLWVTPSGKEVRIEDERFVSFDEKHLVVMRLTVTVLNSDAPVTVACQLLNRQDGEGIYGGSPMASKSAGFDPRKTEKLTDRVLQPREYWQDGDRSALSYEATESGMTIAVVADHEVDTANTYESRHLVEPDIAKNVFRIDARAGVPTTITKFVSYHTSRGVPAGELVDRCRRTVDRARGIGVDALVERQIEWFAAFWERSDVRIGGQADLQQATRWCLFQLARRPHARTARGSRQGRHRVGLQRPLLLGHRGVRAAVPGVHDAAVGEERPPHAVPDAPRRTQARAPAQRGRRSVPVAHDQRRGRPRPTTPRAPRSTTSTRRLLRAGEVRPRHRRRGVPRSRGRGHRGRHRPTVVDARFWRSSDGGDGEDSFHIHGVTGPDEYTTVVNDNLFTNVMARFNLRFAARTVRDLFDNDPEAYGRMADRMNLDPSEPDRWEKAAEAMHIPFSPALGIHPQDAVFLEREIWDLENTPPDQRPLLLHFHPLVIYRYQVLKQADVVLALFLQGNHFTDAEKLADFEYYDPLTTGDSTLSAVVQSILAAEVGYRTSRWSTSVRRRSSTSATCTTTPPTGCTWPPRAGCGRRWSAASAECATTSAG